MLYSFSLTSSCHKNDGSTDLERENAGNISIRDESLNLESPAVNPDVWPLSICCFVKSISQTPRHYHISDA